jgi:hypothetical protein
VSDPTPPDPPPAPPDDESSKPASEYEFDADATDVLRDLHTWMVRDVERARQLAALLVVAAGAVLRVLWRTGRSGAYLAVVALAIAAASAVTFMVANRTERASHAIEQTTRTVGRDVTHFMAAVRELETLFRGLRAAVIAATALLLVACGVALTR